MKKDNKIIILIFLLALFARLLFITKVPSTLSMDEANIGYNAYSILKTGRDEWGNSLPLAFKSVGDYKPPVNIYLTSLSIAIFGLNEFAIRFPVALIGALTSVAFTYLLKEMKFTRRAYFFSGFWLAILPWHIHFSRAGYEAITALFFLILGTWAFLKSINSKSHKLFNLSIIFFSLAVWSYHAQRVFVPLLFLFLIYIFRKKFKYLFNSKNKLVLIIFIAAVFIIPFLYLSFATPAVRTRAMATSVFRDPALTRNLNQGDNDIYLIFRHISGKYLNYFNLRYIFWSGLYTPLSGLMSMGLLYMIDLPIFVLGVIAFAKQKKSLYKYLIAFWFFLGPLPASLTMNEQHSLRALT